MNRDIMNSTYAKSSARAQSLLNPDNMHELLYQYSIQAYSTIMTRFELHSTEQVDALVDYASYQI